MIGKSIMNCQTLPIVEFCAIDSPQLPDLRVSDLSSDQKYLKEIYKAVRSGFCSKDLALRSPGKLAHFRWLTLANRVLRLYVSTTSPDDNLIILATYVMKVYTPVWFAIKTKPSCIDGSRHFYKLMSSSRYLSENLKEIVIRL